MNNLSELMKSNLILENGQNWSIGEETKTYIHSNSMTSSIETGIGYSTFLFAAKSGSHTVCFPDAKVEEEIKKYAKTINLPVDNVKFVVGKSQYTLPSIKLCVDFALIDGEHMYPCPMIDFYYINQMMIVGGTLLIDDMQIPAVRCLYEYLSVSSHWKYEDLLDKGRTCVFVKTSNDPYEWWGSQQFNLTQLPQLHKPTKIKVY